MSTQRFLDSFNIAAKWVTYSFDILKCGRDSCNKCKSVRLPKDIFNSIKHLPFPLPDDHAWALPTLLNSSGKRHNGRAPTVSKGEGIQCKDEKSSILCKSSTFEKCSADSAMCMWRLVYSKYKLPVAERRQLQQLLDEHSYSCGAKLQDLHLEDKFKYVERSGTMLVEM